MTPRILVVDDSPYMRAQISNTLQEAGFNVVGEAENGEQAIDKTFELKPDIITLDNILPDMLGTDVLQIVKSNSNLEAKIIVISGVGVEETIKEVLNMGAVDYIVKPFTPSDLVEAIKNVS